jgi:hypothetical protein
MPEIDPGLRQQILAEAAHQGLAISGVSAGLIARFLACVAKKLFFMSLPQAVFECFTEVIGGR